ncbi:MAG: MOSC domain-containing protein [Planctomycetes bacterium]|nr:MOSC domain-containing protein [Planctomycetota bacterium]
MQGEVAVLSISEKRGGGKRNVEEVRLKINWGIEGDGHAGKWHRQVSLLAMESIQKMQDAGVKVRPGDFGENITTRGVNLLSLNTGDRVIISETVLEITQKGKDCTKPCEIYYQIGDCVMPREGLFARVIMGGVIRAGDPVRLHLREGSGPSEA